MGTWDSFDHLGHFWILNLFEAHPSFKNSSLESCVLSKLVFILATVNIYDSLKVCSPWQVTNRPAGRSTCILILDANVDRCEILLSRCLPSMCLSLDLFAGRSTCTLMQMGIAVISLSLAFAQFMFACVCVRNARNMHVGQNNYENIFTAKEGVNPLIVI